MGITSAATSPHWLHVIGQIAGTLLLLELLVALLVVCALMGGLAFAAWWTHRNVLPVVAHYGIQAQQVIGLAERGSEQVVERIASFRGIQKAVATGLRVFFMGKPRPEAEVVTLGGVAAQPQRQPVAEAAPAGVRSGSAVVTREHIPTHTVSTTVTPEPVTVVETSTPPVQASPSEQQQRARNESRREPPLFNAPA